MIDFLEVYGVIVCCFVVYSPLCKIRANRCESAGTMLIFYFPAPLLERAKRIWNARRAFGTASGSWNGLRLLEQCLGSTWNRPLGYLCIVRWQDGINPYIISVLIRPLASGTPFAATGTARRAIQQTSLLFRDNRWSGNRLRRGGLSSRLGHRLRRELRRLCESLWGLDARGNTG